jgi:hypothetical protein
VAAVRLTGTKPGRARRNRKVRFRSRRGVKHGGSVFRAHHARSRAVFRAHAPKALKGFRARTAKPWKAPKPAAYKGIGTRNPFPVHAKAKAFKAAGQHGHAMRAVKRKKAAKYRAARPKRI